MLPSNSVLSIRTTGREHLMESCHSVAFLEFYDILADLVDDARDVVTLIRVLEVRKPLWSLVVSCVILLCTRRNMRNAHSIRLTRYFPVFGIAAAEDNFDDDLVWPGLGNRGVDDVDLGAGGDKGFLHVVW